MRPRVTEINDLVYIAITLIPHLLYPLARNLFFIFIQTVLDRILVFKLPSPVKQVLQNSFIRKIFCQHQILISASPDCGGVFTQDHGDIASPGFLSSVGYGPNSVCEWEIRLPPNERIKLTWIEFELEPSSSCIFDSVSVCTRSNAQKFF